MEMANPRSLATRSRAVAKEVGRRVVRRVRKVVPERGPILSVVVPAHNVEQYLEECVRSLLDQDYRHLEVIIVENGSTDGTLAVARRLAGESRNVRLVEMPGSGLSAARNYGVKYAKGEFLWFLDSDDTVEPRTASKMIASLQRTGSDFAVACYRRCDDTGRRWKPGHWILDAHAVDRPAVTLRDFPGILVNAVAWSKIYRRSFWDAAGMQFPVGVLYEDQPSSARAYARARSFDVISDVLCNWRVRGDGSSISQQTKEMGDLRHRLGAAADSLAELRGAGLEDVAVERLIQVLSNDLQHSTKHIPEMSEEHWSTLVEGVRRLMEELPEERWAQIPPQHAVLQWLIHADLQAEAVEFVESGGPDIAAWPTRLEDDTLIVQVPFWDHPAVPRTAAIGNGTMRLTTALRRAVWESSSRLRLEGWAYIAGIDLAIWPTQVELWLKHGDHVVPLDVEPASDDDIDRTSKHRWNDYRPSAFRAWVDTEQLPAGDAAKDYELCATVRTGKVERSGAVTNVQMRGSAGGVRARTAPSGLRARLVAAANRPCVVRVRTLPHRVEHVSVVNGAAHVRVHGPFGTAAPSMSLKANGQSVTVQGEASGNSAVFVIDPKRFPALPQGEESSAWIVRLHPEIGVKAEIDWPDSVDPRPVWVDGLRLSRTVAGNFGVAQWAPMLTVDHAEYGADVLQLAGSAHLVTDGAQILLADHRGTVGAPVRVEGDRWTAAVPLLQDRWGGPLRPLPIGRYQLTVAAADGSAPVLVAEGVRQELPLVRSHTTGMYARLETGPRASVVLVVEAPLSPQERGARNQERMRQAHLTRTPSIRPNTVLFRTYYGENCTDTALAVHRELHRRGGYQLYWVVKDYAVTVPEGGIPVLRDSREFYELWGSAQYTMDNVHEPAFFHKVPGQIVVQTIHGYPFKAAGLRNWQSKGVSRAQIRSYLRRHDQWDYLVSPSPYATPLLEIDFVSPAKTLEIGYPRNDVFFSAEAPEIRSRVRRTLGLPAEAKVLLYAPTYREHLAETEFKSRMVEYFDAEAAAEGLGEDWYFLIRGHAMNARTDFERKISGRVIDVTDYPEISELCLASDAAVLDYSSLRFDYALTGNPMLFLVPDLELYRETRGWLLPYEETAPGPLVSTTQEVVDHLRSAGDLRSLYAQERRTFIETFMPLEDGHATERLIDAVMGDPFRQHQG